MAPTTIALAIPTTAAWVPARADSMERVRQSLGVRRNPEDDGFMSESPYGPDSYTEITERSSNKIWPRKMQQWALDTKADWFLTLQDDTLHPPYFWKALRAMLPHIPPNQVLGLSSVHPMAPEIARQGHRWYRTQSWLVGWAYAMRREDLQEFVSWTDARPKLVEACNEDDLLNRWIHASNRYTWHPVPTIVDHDTSIDSQYNNDHHAHRRASCTWRDFGEGSLTDTDFWLPSGEPRQLLVPAVNHCWFCMERPGYAASHKTGAALCRKCLGEMVQQLIVGEMNGL